MYLHLVIDKKFKEITVLETGNVCQAVIEDSICKCRNIPREQIRIIFLGEKYSIKDVDNALPVKYNDKINKKW